jgi:uncharacterized protein YjdB
MQYLSKLTKRLAQGWSRPALVLALTACAVDARDPVGVTGVPSDRISSTTPTSISISPGTASGTLGQSAQFTATVYDSRGRVVTGKLITWTSTDSTVVSINASGVATGIGVGNANLVATTSGVSAQAQVSVTGTAIASIALTPNTASGAVGDSVQFAATMRDASGNVLSGRRVLWTSTAPGVVSVDTAGWARALSVGTATITATSAGISASAATSVLAGGTVTPPAPTVARVVVSPSSASGNVGDSAPFTATAYDSAGAAMTGLAVSWATSNAAVVTVTSAGYATATGAGSASVTATIGGASASAAITVAGAAPSAPVVARVVVNPASASGNVGDAAQFSAIAYDATGAAMTGQTIAWSSSNPAVVTVNSAGYATAIGAGTASLVARAGTVTGTSAITVLDTAPAPAPVPAPAPTPVLPTGGNTSTSTGWTTDASSWPLLSDNPFDLVSALGWYMSEAGPSIALDPTAPASASNVLQFTYPAGLAGGGGEGLVAHGLGDTRHVYGGYWAKSSANWQGHASNVNKMAFLYANGGAGDMYLCFYGPPGGPYEVRTALQFIGADSRTWLTPNVANVPYTVGVWHRVEWMVDMGTAGSANGIVKFWLDGTLIGSYNNVLFPSTSFTEFQFAPTWGGIGDFKQHTDYLWLDHVILKAY